MKRLIAHILAASLGIWAAVSFIPKVSVAVYPTSNIFGFPLTQPWHIYLLLGAVLGLLNFFVKPALDILTLPLRIITLGLFGFLINMGLLWAVDYIFNELRTPWFWPLFWTTLLVWLLHAAIAHTIAQTND